MAEAPEDWSMAGQDDGEVTQVMEITGLDPNDREIIVNALKSHSNSVMGVINEFFNDSDGFRKKYTSSWDDSMFTSNRDGSQNQTGLSYHVEAPDQQPSGIIHGVEPPPQGHYGAPSRPPSRANARSPMAGVVDWTAGNAGAAPRSQTQEDEDMERALRESAQEAGLPVPEQETGVTGPPTSAPYFGPANRDTYDASQWAMVTSGAQVETISDQTLPSQRARKENAPAFLLDGSNNETGPHRLGALLTILHEIPLGRNALLQEGKEAASYGHNSQWWQGQEIVPPHVLAQASSGEVEWEQQPEGADFHEELHRLMAFLDSTERSYGSAAAISGLITNGWQGMEKNFYRQLKDRTADQEELPFLSSVVVPAPSEDEEPDGADFCLLETMNSQGFDNVTTLYEWIDDIVWGDMLSYEELTEDLRMASFKRFADIMTFDISASGRSIGIPEEFCPERWHDNRREEAWKIQVALRSLRMATRKINQEKAKLYQLVDSGKVQDGRVVANRAVEGYKSACEYLEGRGRFRTVEESKFDLHEHPDYREAPSQMSQEEEKLWKKMKEGADYSQGVLDSKRRRMEVLNEELDQIRLKQRFLGQLLTKREKDGRPKPMECKRYLLQGVATSSGVVYVCKRTRVDLIQFDEAPAQPDQWWRLEFNPSDRTEPVKAETTTYEQIREQMWNETKNPLLVYASESAIHTEPLPLSDALKRFVKADNKAFRQELHQETVEPTQEVAAPELRSPKRKHRADSVNSMDSNRASAGSESGRASNITGVDGAKDPTSEDAAVFGMRSQTWPTTDDKSPFTAPAPTLPQGQEAPTENTSSSATPVTLAPALDDGSASSRETQQTTPPEAPISTAEEPKDPEMQERFQMPTLKRFLTGDDPERKGKASGPMDMD